MLNFIQLYRPFTETQKCPWFTWDIHSTAELQLVFVGNRKFVNINQSKTEDSEEPFGSCVSWMLCIVNITTFCTTKIVTCIVTRRFQSLGRSL